MQAPGGPEEDRTGSLEHGGWTVPHWDDAISAAIDETFSTPFDLLLGRKPSGVMIVSYERAGDVKTGSFALENPTESEIERRKGFG